MLFIIFITIYFTFSIVTEEFYGYNFYNQYDKCKNCGDNSRDQCSACNNCGWCLHSDGYGQCVPGDVNGPYFRQDCYNWFHKYDYLQYPYHPYYNTVQINSYPGYKSLYRPSRSLPRNRKHFYNNRNVFIKI